MTDTNNNSNNGYSLKLISSMKKEAPFDKIWNLAWHPSGDILATCANDKLIQIWTKDDKDNWVLAKSLEAHEKTVRRVAWSPCGRFLAGASFDASTSIWEKTKDQLDFNHVSSLEGHTYEVKSVAWDSSGTLLATCSRDKSIWVWQMEEDNDFECLSINSGHGQDIKCVLWHPQEELLASSSYDDTIKFWKDIDGDWLCMYTLTGHESSIWDISFNKDGSKLVSCGEDKQVFFWKYDKENDKWINIFKIKEENSRPIYSIDWSHLTNKICSGSADDSIVIYEEGTGDNKDQYKVLLKKEGAHDSDVNCTKWNPKHENILASCGDDGTIKIWELIKNN
ncbi:hypothetical protein DICPUDRAFT_74124 [Dictyostelium purpureum]|uniref:Probable cytosolic iron-sulfur protein assembly protein CIAO1 homolog n=1 Tax=Dictyostelium purpureum TaxID=5786 RepID=F0Z6Q0_DICPU|nr:uncharacterized protein DICPUDRAFT_74124 [Dictyostelium purpureum]EGC40348.1 hypothetical protein DICPUDRAFT_74124 [Dictyostelium purpureum]|eukprot:XP_003283099.1 hypothetical protein DICPUDRAFT_74124 [Dictyostelium purpureum]